MGRPNLVNPPGQKFKRTTINRLVAGLGRNWHGDGKAASFCGRVNLKKIDVWGVG
jgi:hypothetical protein